MLSMKLGTLDTHGLNDAVRVIEECKIQEPCYGFQYPFFAPGGLYGKQWWFLDGAISLNGYKWLDQTMSENAVRNYAIVQRPDGRIPLWGADMVPASWSHELDLIEVSAFPELLTAAAAVARRSKDAEFLALTYHMLKNNLRWWHEARLNRETGLITAIFEETFRPYPGDKHEYIPVDTTAKVAVGCEAAAELGDRLGFAEEASALREQAKALFRAVETHLWDEEKGFFFPHSLLKGEQEPVWFAQSFFALYDREMDPARRARVLALMQQPEVFGWGSYYLTSVARTDPSFTVTRGDYAGNASWSGMVWSLINHNVVCALERIGEQELAAELAYHTLQVFDHNCQEFADPFDGSGHGVKSYGWTAAHYLLLVIDHLFGVDYNAECDTLTIRPNIPQALKAQPLHLAGLPLPCGGTLSVFCQNGRVSWSLEGAPARLKVLAD